MGYYPGMWVRLVLRCLAVGVLSGWIGLICHLLTGLTAAAFTLTALLVGGWWVYLLHREERGR